MAKSAASTHPGHAAPVAAEESHSICWNEVQPRRRAMRPRVLIARSAAAVSLILLLLVPASAQYWGDSWGDSWGGRQQRREEYHPFNGGSWGDQQWERDSIPRERPPFSREREREVPRSREPVIPDYSSAPRPSQKRLDATTSIMVMGDANADWLAYGLEDALSEKPEFGVVRKHRTESGLIHYGGRGDSEWPQVVREIIAAEKPKFVVMMIGNNDHQQIREKAPAVKPGVPKANAQPAITSQ